MHPAEALLSYEEGDLIRLELDEGARMVEAVEVVAVEYGSRGEGPETAAANGDEYLFVHLLGTDGTGLRADGSTDAGSTSRSQLGVSVAERGESSPLPELWRWSAAAEEYEKLGDVSRVASE